ncbi:MAG: PadR family transcriptional regulator [Candidatus Heimdallarchaeota archaeon]|nr:PadR family transcriptional regulator [Candidatus Heimdallarchaeota archaeon]MBY8994531.1 PadR family transcriptional regulator [Candidatus Heimdallarchaeota archaeon]
MSSSYLDKDDQKETSKAFKRLMKKTSIDNLWIYILRLLQEKEMYGYELKESIKTKFGFEPATVTSYTILYKLEKDNLVISHVQDNPEGRPDRKYYAITSQGKKAMKEAKGLFEEILTKVFDKTK